MHLSRAGSIELDGRRIVVWRAEYGALASCGAGETDAVAQRKAVANLRELAAACEAEANAASAACAAWLTGPASVEPC